MPRQRVSARPNIVDVRNAVCCARATTQVLTCVFPTWRGPCLAMVEYHSNLGSGAQLDARRTPLPPCTDATISARTERATSLDMRTQKRALALAAPCSVCEVPHTDETSLPEGVPDGCPGSLREPIPRQDTTPRAGSRRVGQPMCW